MKLFIRIIVLSFIMNSFINCTSRIHSKNEIKNTKSTFTNSFNSFRRKAKIFDSKECLESEDLIKKKYSENNYKDISKRMMNRLRFIHGNCNPVVVVPGVLASKIEAVFNCNKVNLDENLKKEITFHCGKEICKTEKMESHVFWPDINTSVFKMELDDSNLFNSCYGYFLRFYNRQKSCLAKKEVSDETDTTNNTNTEKDTFNPCKYSEFIRLVPFGLAKNDGDEAFNCGFNAVNNFHNAKGIIDLVSLEATKGFQGIFKKLKEMGYREGFSMAAIPYEFKEAFCQNDYFKDTLKQVVNYLFKLTGKKVIVIAHSYGNLNSHYQLTSDPGFYKDRIAHFISLAAPFSGTYKGDFLIARGTNEFYKDESIIELDVSRFSQSIGMMTTLTAHMLRKFNFIDTIKDTHPDLSEALKKYLNFSTCLISNNQDTTKCNYNDRSALFTLFKSEFVWLEKEKCLKHSRYLSKWKLDNKIKNESDYDNFPIFDVCDYSLFDYVNCPSIKLKNQSRLNNYVESDSSIVNELCQSKSENSQSRSFFISDCNDKSKKCTDEYVRDYYHTPLIYPKHTEAMCKKFIPKITLEQCAVEIPSFFNFYKKSNIRQTFEEVTKICNKEKRVLNHPGVPTTILFNRSILTRSAILAETDISKAQERADNLFIGGDGTVDGDSPLFVGLKWLYDSKKDSNLPKIQIFDYCSPISKTSDHIYNGRESLRNGKQYQFLKCRCNYLNSQKVDNCAHAEMLGDENIINLISDIVFNEKIYDLKENIYAPTPTIAMNDSSIKYDKSTTKLCFEIFYNTYHKNFNKTHDKKTVKKRLRRMEKTKK